MRRVYYVAYGSNLNLKDFLRRCPNAKFLGTTFLLNKALVFKGDDEELSYLTLEDEIGSSVPVGVFELSYFDALRLDKYEGFPTLYSKKSIDLHFNSCSIKAFYYIMNSKFDYHLPSLEYLNSCARGYECFNFDKEVLIKALKVTNERRCKSR